MVNWHIKHYSELTLEELYQVLRLRLEVFAVEQQCVYQDCDNKDQESWHLMGWEGNNLVAYARLLPPGLSYNTASIGRVVTASDSRGQGLGKELMLTAIGKTRELFGHAGITISAQVYLQAFYSSFGFQTIGVSYIEDEIEHIRMKMSFLQPLHNNKL